MFVFILGFWGGGGGGGRETRGKKGRKGTGGGRKLNMKRGNGEFVRMIEGAPEIVH